MARHGQTALPAETVRLRVTLSDTDPGHLLIRQAIVGLQKGDPDMSVAEGILRLAAAGAALATQPDGHRIALALAGLPAGLAPDTAQAPSAPPPEERDDRRKRQETGRLLAGMFKQGSPGGA